MRLTVEPLTAVEGVLPLLPDELDDPVAQELVAAVADGRVAARERLADGLGPLPWSDLVEQPSNEVHAASRPTGGYDLPDPDALADFVAGVDGRTCLASAEIGGSPQDVDPLWFDRANDTRRLNPIQVESLLAAGGVLQLIAIEEHEDRLGAVAADLETAIGGVAQANLFYSDGSESGTGRHFDDPELFVFQLDGPKRWEVHRTVYDHPRRGIQDGRRADPSAVADQIFDGVLEPGDVLYVPRGHWHLVTPQGGRSMHITVALGRPAGFGYWNWVRSVSQRNDAVVRAP